LFQFFEIPWLDLDLVEPCQEWIEALSLRETPEPWGFPSIHTIVKHPGHGEEPEGQRVKEQSMHDEVGDLNEYVRAKLKAANAAEDSRRNR